MKKIKNYLLLLLLVITPMHVGALTKSESVYTNLNSDGSINKSVVTNHLYLNGKTSIEDETELKNIMNINGDESYTTNGNKIVWNNINKDIYYEGTTENKLPVTTKITYYLDNKKMEAKDMVGKKGNVKIKLEFTNNSKRYLNNKSLYTPFVVTFGTILNNTDNSNIKITNGKVVDTGTRSTILAISSPGLYESLNVSSLSNLNTITLSYTTSNFTTNDFYIVATPKLLSNVDLTIFNKVDTLTESASLLSENMNKLIDGINSLDEGNKTLEDSTKVLSENMNTISNYIDQINNKTGDLNNNILLLKNSIISSKEELNNLVSASSNTEGITLLINKNTSVRNSLISKTNMTYEELINIYNSNSLSTYTGDDTTLLNIKNTVELITLLDTNTTTINKLTSSTSTLVEKVNNSLDTLISNIDKLYNGTTTLDNSMTLINTNTKKINAGTKKLSESTKLLKNGSEQLLEGANKFNDEGINELVKYSSIITDKMDTLKDLVNLSKNYNGYASNNSNETIFVYKVDAIR
jgi:putative membrane protein